MSTDQTASTASGSMPFCPTTPILPIQGQDKGRRTWKDIQHNLQNLWPLSSTPDHTDVEDHSGVDCMVVVLRQTLAVLGESKARALLDQYGHSNPLLRLAACDFSLCSEEDEQAFLADRDTLYKTIQNIVPVPSFENVDMSPLMQETVWGDGDFHRHYQSIAEDLLGTAEEDLKIKHMCTSRSLIPWTVHEHESFQNVMDSEDNPVLDFQGSKYAFSRKIPALLRVLFDATRRDNVEVDISDLWRIPCDGHRPELVDGQWHHMQVSNENLCLVAIVRLRNTPEEHDHVRLYGPNGHPISPKFGRDYHQPFCHPEWSVGDKDHRLMLYYGYCKNPGGGEIPLRADACEIKLDFPPGSIAEMAASSMSTHHDVMLADLARMR